VIGAALYEEGKLVSSTIRDVGKYLSHDFVFDSASTTPIATSLAYAPRPIGPGFQRSFVSWRDRSRSDKHLNDLPPDSTSVRQRLNVVCPTLWTAENPHIYTLVISLRSSRDNVVIQAESCRVGFRSVEINDGYLKVNQKPIMVRGTNYHEHDPVTGHCVSSQLLEADVKLMKRYNFNAVRTSHYPQAPMFYEFCNLYGLYVVDEANIETHGMLPYAGRLSDSSFWERAYMRRLLRMIHRDRNHPSVIAWSLGNESGYGRTHDKMASLVRAYEKDRVLMYEPATYGPRDSGQKSGWFGGRNSEGGKGAIATDILCPMYPRVDDCIVIANRNPDMPVILCEYAHMMGNSGGNLDTYWKWFNNFSRLQGGFIWDWADQGICVTDSTGAPLWTYGGDFGELYHDGAFCLNGLNWPDRGLGDVLTQSRLRAARSRHAYLMSSMASQATELARLKGRVDGVLENDCVAADGASTVEKVLGADFSLRSDIDARSPLSRSLYHRDMSISREVYGLECLRLDPTTLRRLKRTEEMEQRDSSKFQSLWQNQFVGGNEAAAGITPNSSVQGANRIIHPFPVESAIPKPQLLEAKQCMKVFECEVTGLHPTSWHQTESYQSSRSSVRSDHSGQSLPGNTVVSESTSTNLKSSSEYALNLTVHFSILNRLNHTAHVEDFLYFDVLLLCDGMVVDRRQMSSRSRHGATSKRHVFDSGDGMAGLQELEMSCNFNVKLVNSNVPPPEGLNAVGGSFASVNDSKEPRDPMNGLIRPSLPLSRSCGVFLPTAAPSSVQSDGQPQPQQAPPGWTTYGYAWPEDAMLQADSFDNMWFPTGSGLSSSGGSSMAVEYFSSSLSGRSSGMGGATFTPGGKWAGITETHLYTPRDPKVADPSVISKSDSRAAATGLVGPKAAASVATAAGNKKWTPSLWSDVTASTRWSTVVIGRLRNDTPWAKVGYPMGFAQNNISGQLVFSLLPKRVAVNTSQDPLRVPPLPLPSHEIAAIREDSTEEGADVAACADELMAGGVDLSSPVQECFDIQKPNPAVQADSNSSPQHPGHRLRSRSGSWTDPNRVCLPQANSGRPLELSSHSEQALRSNSILSRDSAESLPAVVGSSYQVSVLFVENKEQAGEVIRSPDILLRGGMFDLHSMFASCRLNPNCVRLFCCFSGEVFAP
jgi:hypothetical protein